MEGFSGKKGPALYALRGVSGECPENTESAIRTAICQGYDGIVLDIQVTADGVPVAGRLPGISEMAFAQAALLDVGGAFARKYQGERILPLDRALDLAQEAGISLCLGMDLIQPHQETALPELLKGRGKLMCCCRDAGQLLRIAHALPDVSLGYSGTEEKTILPQLAPYRDRLTFWIPDGQDAAVRAAALRGYGKLAVTELDDYARLEQLCGEVNLSAAASTGRIKPLLRKGFRSDIHIHSEYSQDSSCPLADIEADAVEKGMDLVCITDHCDIRPDEDIPAMLARRRQVFRELESNRRQPQGLQTLIGVELGGGFFNPEAAQQMVLGEKYDLVIGSVHGIFFRGMRQSTSGCDFGKLEEAELLEYISAYMECELYVAQKLDVDILAHMTYVLRYINGKYGRNISWRVEEDRIRRILAAIIARGIPLEINTSCRGGKYDEWLPCREIVDLYLDMGGYLFTLGSDAHVSGRIGSYFDEVTAYLRSRGVRYAVYFRNRIACQYSICAD